MKTKHGKKNLDFFAAKKSILKKKKNKKYMVELQLLNILFY